MLKFRFYLHSKVLEDGARPIFFDVRWAGTRAADPASDSRMRGGAGASVLPGAWDEENMRVRSKGVKDYAVKNRKLNELRGKIEDFLTAADANHQPVTPAALRAHLRPGKPAPAEISPDELSVQQIYEQWAAHYRVRYSRHTLRKPAPMVQHIAAWRTLRGQPPECPINLFRLDPKLRRCAPFDDFCAYLLEEARIRNPGRHGAGLDNNTAGSYIKALRTLVKFSGLPYDWMEDPYSYETDKEPLEFEEVLRLATLDVPPRLGRVRDLFVFNCFSGPRFENLMELGPANMKTQHGVRVLKYNQFKGKVKEDVLVALDPLALEIWDRYQGALPRYANYSYNCLVKELAQLAGLDRPVHVVRVRGKRRLDEVHPLYEVMSAHTARHTFATLLLDGGAELTDVQDGLGHSSIQVTRRYAKSRAERRHKVTLGAFDRLRQEQADAAHRAESVHGVPDSGGVLAAIHDARAT